MAMDDLLNEHEQSERVRTWLQKNAAGLIGGVVLGLGLVGGWQWWQKQQLAGRVEASQQYDKAIKAIAANPADAAKQVAALKDQGPYAALAGLQLAKAQVEANQRDAAISTLRNIKNHDAGLAEVINQRLARLLIDAGKPSDAIKLLDNADSAGMLEVRGDALHALGQRDAARDVYGKALSKIDMGSPQRRLLELKLTDVGGLPAKPANKT
ncbi:MAG: tetratricopeptide repeat protein [Lysobacter sp.]|nr:tetratricopeptide repeat protein [Lysobacter sp.]